MLSIVELLSSHAPSVSVRSLVRRTHGNPAAQREIVVDGVRRATCLTADGVIYARRSLMPYVMEEFKKWSKQKRSEALSSGKKKTSESNEENYNDTSNRNDPTKTEEATQGEDSFVSQLLSSRFSSKTTQEAVEELVNNLTPSDYYVEVAPERKVMESFFPNRMFSGVNIAVADVFDVRGFHTRGGLQSTLMMREGKEELPLLSWFKKEGGTVVGKLNCQTPLGLYEGCEFGPQKPIAAAVRSGSAHYVITASLTSPAALTACVSHDMVGFKPTSQTIGSFSKPFRLTIPSASIGVAAARVDDLLFLWQTYTAALDVNIPPQKKKETSNSNNTTTSEQKESIETEKEAPEKKEEVAEAKATPGDHNSSSTVEASSSAPSSTTETSPPEGSTSGEEANKTPAEPHPQTAATSVGNHKATNAVRSQHSAYVAARDRTGDASTNSTKAILADIDVGWKDYNAIGMGADEFHLITNRPKRRWWLPSVIRRAVFGKKLEEDYLHIPRVELAIGYPAEWIDAHCAEMYGGAKGFHTLLNDAAYRRGTANLLSNRIEIIPIAFDFRLEDVQWSCNVIAQYELVRALESLYDHYSLAKGDAQSNRLQSIEAFLQELPPSIIEAVGKGQKLSKSAYENAWRVRDDVIRSSEEQFQDVDAFVLPLLAAPYTSGSPSSNLLTLPFHLGGHPMLSLQLDQRVPVGLVGELGRDAALLEDALRFVEFVRGDAPSWWRRTMFGAAATPTTVVKPAEETAGKETTEEKKEATP